MYTKDGEKYFILDAHIALWDARPENQRNVHGKQFIDCFYDYHRNLSPASELWPYEEYLYQGGERLMKDLFTDGYVDHAIFQPARLGEFYVNGFGQTQEAFALASANPDKLTYNHWFDPRDGERVWTGCAGRRGDAPQGRQALHRGLARGLPRLQAQRPLDLPVPRGLPRGRHQEHPRPQGPDDPPARPRRVRRGRRGPRRDRLHRPELRRGALRAAAPGGLLLDRHPGPNVYAGLAVALPFIHTRPRYFAQIIGELLYWLDENRIFFSSDYALWTPKWLVETFVDFQIPEDMSEYAPLTTDQKKKILGLNAAAIYDIPVPEELQVANPPQHAEPQAVAVA